MLPDRPNTHVPEVFTLVGDIPYRQAPRGIVEARFTVTVLVGRLRVEQCALLSVVFGACPVACRLSFFWRSVFFWHT